MRLPARKLNILFCFLFFCSFFSKAQLVINEVSQGPTGGTGTKEYVELVVVGSPTCTTVPCFDLRGYYIDDNNGTFATGAGVGIANGCIRFTTNALWSCIPAGTIIVIYNDGDINANLPAVDLSMSDGNCRLIIPGSDATLLERNTSSPSTASSAYPTAGFVTGSSWTSTVAMANGGDSFQTRDASGNLLSSVSWGNNSTSTIIYFAGSESGKVCNNLNLVDNNPTNQANWATAVVAGNETPGVANNAANAAWINSMNFTCGSVIPPALTASVSSTNAGCTCTGSATVTASGAVAPYTYSWSPSGGAAATASNLCAGNYSVTVTSANGCVLTVTVNIGQSSSVTASITSTSVSCNGGSNGLATVAVVNGVAPITYTWSPSGGNNITATNLTAGNYSVTITDANNCTATATTTINQPSTLSVSVSSANVLCNGGSNGSATVTVTGGISPYTYTWSSSGGNNAAATNLTQGTYTVNISDANLCTKSTQVVITQPPALTLTLTSSPETCEQKNGTASAAASGGTGTLQYSWTPSGGNVSSATNLQAGTYSLTVTDANACILSNTVTVQGFLSPVLSVSSTSVLCNAGNSGAATSSIVSGGTPAYTYTWSPSGGNNSSANNLSAGNYTLIVTDAKGCKDTAYANIAEPPAITTTLASTPATCGNNNGTATSTVTGGVAPYTYTWSPSGGNNLSATNLATGNYTLNIADANACTFSTSIHVGNKPAPILSVTSTSVVCFGASTGSASVTINAGTGTSPFTYAWSSSGGNNPTATNLAAGNYTVLVTDSANCTSTTTININQPAAPLSTSITSTAATCNQSNGTASVTVSGGTTGYTYTWLPSGGNNSSANNLSAGNYTLIVTDAKGCKDTAYANITSPSAITATLTSTPATCGNNNGTITSIVTGGLTPYIYIWSPSGGNNSSANNLSSGNYTLNIADANACTFSASINVGNKPTPILSVTSTSVACFGASTGSASVTINAGTGTAPFGCIWLPSGGNNPTATNLAAGNYTVVVTDSANCTTATTVNINQPTAPLSTTITSTAAMCNQSNGTTSVTVNGGTPGYTYTWSPSGGNNSTANNLTGNIIYTVNITDANACVISTQTLVAQNSTISLTLTSTPATCGNTNGSATVVATGGAPAQTGYTYLWTPSGGNNSTTNNLTGNTTYVVSVEDSLQCIASKTVTIGNKPSPVLSIISTSSVTCFGLNNGSATVGVNAGTGTLPLTYTWLPSGGNNSTANNLSAGNYMAVVSDSANCIDTINITINQPPALTATATSTLATCGNANGVATCNVSGGVSGYTYTWTPGGGNSATATNLAGNITYTCSITDANLCTATTSTFVNQTLPLTMTVSSTQNVTCNNGSDGSISVNSNGSINATYFWLPSGGNVLTATNLTASVLGTTYTLFGNDNGCTDSVTATLTEPPALTVTVNNQHSCGGVPVTLTSTVSGGNNATLTYTWNPAGTSTASTATVNPAATTNYTVLVQNVGCSQIAQAISTVTVSPPLVITVTPNDSICNGQSTMLTATATGGGGGTNTYHWSTGASTPNINVSPLTSTIYTVSAQNANCATAATATTQVVIYTNPLLNIITTPTSGCASICISFTASVTNIPGNSVTSYTWNFGDGNSYSGPNTGHCYYQSSNYNVTLSATTQNNCTETLTKPNLVQVHANPVADFSTSTFTTNIDAGTIYFYNQSSSSVTNWNWQIDTTKLSIQNPTHTFLNEGTYPVTLIVKDAAGCTDTVVKNIIINPEFAFYAPNCITPNGDGRNELFLPEGTGWDNTSFNLWIFDRWGNTITHITNPYQGWNGTKHNEIVQEDTYVWEVELNDIFGKPHQYSGTVSVVR